MALTISNIFASPISPISFYPSLLEMEFSGADTIYFSATQNTAIKIKWWAPGNSGAANKEYTFLPNTNENETGNVFLSSQNHLVIKNPVAYMLPLPGSYQVTLPANIFQNQTFANTVSDRITIAGGIATATSKAVNNSGNLDFFIAIGSDASDRLIGGNQADFFEGGKGDDRIEGGGRNPLFSFENGALVASDSDGRARDIVFYNADRSHFEILQKPNGEFTVRDTRSGSENLGTDTLKDIDMLVFKSDKLRPVQENDNEYRYIDAVELKIDVGMNDGGSHPYYMKGSFVNDVISEETIALTINPSGGSEALAAARYILDRSSWIDGGKGDDIILAGSGKDSIYGGLGNDFIDGGNNGRSLNDWNRVDQGEYDGPRSRFTIQRFTDDSSGTKTGTPNKTYFTVRDNGTDLKTNQGTDTYINTERLWFSEGENTGTSVNLVDTASFYVNTSSNNPSASMNVQGSIFDDDIKLSKYFDITKNRFYGSNWDLEHTGSPTLNGSGNLISPDLTIWQSDEGTPYYSAVWGPRFFLKTELVSNFWGQLGAGNDRFEFDVEGLGGGINTGAGNDVVIGQARDALPTVGGNNSWQENINVNFDGAYKRYIVTQEVDDAEGSKTGIANIDYIKVVDILAADRGGTGTDYLVNIDSINFSDRNLNAKVSYWQSTAWNWNGSSGTQVNSGVGTNGSIFKDLIGAPVGSSAELTAFFAGDDNIDGGQGDDRIYAGAGTDTLRGGAGNDYLDGGNEIRSVATQDLYWSSGGYGSGDVAQYSGLKERYIITRNTDDSLGTKTGVVNGAYYTVKDTKLNGDGEDTLVDIEVVQFADGQTVFLKTASQKETWSYNLGSQGNFSGVQWKITGSIYGDVITGHASSAEGSSTFIRDWIDGGLGDDTIYALAGSDYITGGQGNDYIDGGADGDASLSFWDRVDTAVYDGPSSRFIITRNDDDSITVADKLSDSLGGLGVDTLINIEKIQFSNATINTVPQIYDNTYNGQRNINIEGTNFGDRIDLEQSSFAGANSIYVNTGNGDDIVFLGTGNFGANLKRGFDIVDGGAGVETVNMQSYRSRFEVTKLSFLELQDDNAQHSAVKVEILARYQDPSTRPNEIFVVRDLLPDQLGGYGTKYLFNVENISFLYKEGETSHLNLVRESFNPNRGTEFSDNFVVGDSFINGSWLTGLAGDDYFEIVPTQNSRYISITGGAGDDEVQVSDSSLDTVNVQFSGDFHRYLITRSGSTFTVTDTLATSLGGDGTDTLVNVKSLSFSNTSFNIENYDTFTRPTPPAIGSDEVFVATQGYSSISLYQYDIKRFEIRASTDSDGINQLIVKDLLPSTTPGSLGEDTYIGYSHISFANQYINLKTYVSSWYNSWNKTGQLNYSGTIFDDVFEAKVSDYQHYVQDVLIDPVPTNFSVNINAGAGNDILFAGVGGSWLSGGLGNDLIDGGANGTGIDEWQNRDSVNTNTTYEFSRIHELLFSGSRDALVITFNGNIYSEQFRSDLALDIASSVDRAIEYMLTAEQGNRAFDSLGNIRSDYLRATVIEDLNPVSLGGQGVDVLFGIENIQFTDKYYQQSPNFQLNNWNVDDGIPIDNLSGQGTERNDVMTLAELAKFTNKSVSELQGISINFNGNDGNDILTGGTAGDWFSPGAGNDVVDGGSNIGNDRWGNPNRDSVQIDAKVERFDLIEVTLQKGGDGVWVQNSTDRTGFSANYQNSAWEITDNIVSGRIQLSLEQRTAIADTLQRALSNLDASLTSVRINFVSDRLPAQLSGLGTDALINIEQINFSNSWMQLRADPWYSRDETGRIYHAGVNGTKANDVLGKTSDTSVYDWSGDDWLDGGAGNDSLFGGAGGDNLRGGSGDDLLDGGANGQADSYGNTRGDTAQFSGSFNNYTITQDQNGAIIVEDNSSDGDGRDTLINIENLGFSDQWINVSTNQWINRDPNTNQVNNVHYSGSIFNEVINHAASSYANVSADLNGNLGDDILIGGRASDYFRGGQGDDTIVGGGFGLNQWGQMGGDTVSYDGLYSRFTITNLDEGETVEVAGKTYASTLEAPILIVEDSIGDDLGGNGVDILIGIQRVNFSDRNYSVSSSASSLDLDGDGRPDNSVIIGTDKADSLVGTNLADRIEGGAGNDTLTGLAGADYLIGGSGNDDMDGGGGLDTAEFSGSRSQYSINRVSDFRFTVSSSRDGQDVLTNIEKIKFNDGTFVLIAPEDVGVDVNKDLITDYTLRWGTDIFGDTLNVSNSNQSYWLEGLEGNDTLIGGLADDILVGGLGDDFLDGGSGWEDIAIIRGSMVAPTFSNGQYVITTDDGTDTLVNITKVVFDDGEIYLDSVSAITTVLVDSDGDGLIDTKMVTGSTGNDAITGDSLLSNQIDAGLGDDSVLGGAGSDHFIGGLGVDVYDGGNSTIDQQGLGKLDYVWYDGNYDPTPDSEESDYTVTQGDDGFIRVLKKDDSNHVDILKNIEQINFANTTLDIGVQSVSKGVWSARGIAREYIFSGSDFDDVFTSTSGKDTFTGRGGSDLFKFVGSSSVDTILDFEAGDGGDILQFNSSQFENFDEVISKATAIAQGTQIDLGSGNAIILNLVGISDLTAENFDFV